MREILCGSAFFPVVLTLAAYALGAWLQRRTGSAAANPILVGALVAGAALTVTGVPVEAYQAGCESFSWLLTPATVCLAIPLYRQFSVIKKDIRAILAGIVSGTAVSLGCIWAMCMVMKLGRALTVSLLPKSITTAMGIVLSESAGGLDAVTTAAIIVTGVLGNIAGERLCRIFRLTDPVAQGTALGTSAHVIGTARASKMDANAGATGSLALVVAGILTALVFPMITG